MPTRRVVYLVKVKANYQRVPTYHHFRSIHMELKINITVIISLDMVSLDVYASFLCITGQKSVVNIISGTYMKDGSFKASHHIFRRHNKANNILPYNFFNLSDVFVTYIEDSA